MHAADDPYANSESQPIADTLDSWYLDMRKSLMVKVRSHELEATANDALHDKQM